MSSTTDKKFLTKKLLKFLRIIKSWSVKNNQTLKLNYSLSPCLHGLRSQISMLEIIADMSFRSLKVM